MSRKPKILVTSAAGKTGLPTTLQLLEKGYEVRAFVRQQDQRSDLLKKAGAEIFVGNAYSFSDMNTAMQDIQRAYHCAPTALNGLHFGTVFALAARENKLEHVVILSQWLAHQDHPAFLTREVWLNENLMSALEGISLTVNNVGWFASNYLMVLAPIAQLGILPMPLGDGDEKKDAPPSNEDIAAVNVAALTNPVAHAGKTYRPTGPKLMSPNDIAESLSNILGRTVRYQNISEKLFVKAMIANGFPLPMISQLARYSDEYRRGTFAIHSPTSVIEDLAGREAEGFESLARKILDGNPDAEFSLTNRVRAITGFLKILMTSAPDLEIFEKSRDHILLEQPQMAQAHAGWMRSHDPESGYIPDKPYLGHNTSGAKS